MANNKKTPLFDWDQGEFKIDSGRVITATGTSAIEVIVVKAQQTARGVYLIYANPEEPDLNHKYGTDVYEILSNKDLNEETRLSELSRATREALIYDEWISDAYNITIVKQASGELLADFTIKTIYDTEVDIKGVVLNGG